MYRRETAINDITLPAFGDLAAPDDAPLPPGEVIGASRAGRPLAGYRFGDGTVRVSLIAGCHADEPVGPILLRRLVRFLAARAPREGVLSRFSWWIVPHINPDGAERNRAWSHDAGDAYDFATYLAHVVRELPGDDIEFGFPRDATDAGARPENRAVYDWWRSSKETFALHVSLHGMAVAGGPWFLIDPAWTDRCHHLMERCTAITGALGYGLHDVERHGEKGFKRIGRGFATRPNSVAMARYFLDRKDTETAARFRPSSMEAIRQFGGDALTLVSEVPLFILPGVGDTITPTDPAADAWRERIAGWRQRLQRGEAPDAIRREAGQSGVRGVPLLDQMNIQWEMIRAGLEQVTGRHS